MAYDVNEMTIVGRLGANPEIKSFQNGGRIANLRVATSEQWKDKQTGEKQERTEWHSVTARGDGLIGFIEKNLHKGSRVYVRGKLQTRKWQDQSGNDRYSTEIVVAGYEGKILNLSDKPRDGGSGQPSGQGSGSVSGGSGGQSWNDQRLGGGHQSDSGGSGGFGDDLDDDIPFE